MTIFNNQLNKPYMLLLYNNYFAEILQATLHVLPVCLLSVPYGLVTWKQKSWKIKIGINIPQNTSKVPIFS